MAKCQSWEDNAVYGTLLLYGISVRVFPMDKVPWKLENNALKDWHMLQKSRGDIEDT